MKSTMETQSSSFRDELSSLIGLLLACQSQVKFLQASDPRKIAQEYSRTSDPESYVAFSRLNLPTKLSTCKGSIEFALSTLVKLRADLSNK